MFSVPPETLKKYQQYFSSMVQDASGCVGQVTAMAMFRKSVRVYFFELFLFFLIVCFVFEAGIEKTNR